MGSKEALLASVMSGLLQDFNQDGASSTKLKLAEVLLKDTGRESLELSLAHFQDP